MAIHLHILNAAGSLNEFDRRIRHTVETTSKRVRRLIPIASIDLVVQVMPQLTIPEIGIGGYSPAAELIYIYLNPLHERFSRSVESEFAPILAHELLHCARWLGPGYGNNLGEALISEGIALHFEAQFRGHAPFYAVGLTDAQIDDLEKEAHLHLNESNYGHLDWFGYSGGRGFPRYAGYALGYRIMSRSLASLGCEVHAVYNRPAKYFFDTLAKPVSSGES